MKISLAQLNYKVGDITGNCEKITNAINDARQEGADLVVFSELAVCGYPPRDLLTYPRFISQCEKAVEAIAKHSQDIAIILGSPRTNPNSDQKPLFNSAYFIKNGEVQSIVNKTLLPAYDIFDEPRFFERSKTHEVLELHGARFALTICEDIWNYGQFKIYPDSPLDHLSGNYEFIINISASPFDQEQPAKRNQILRHNIKEHQVPIILVNQVGGNNDVLFDGSSLAMASNGQTELELPRFQEKIATLDLNPSNTSEVQEHSSSTQNSNSSIPDIYDALIMGIRDYFRKLGFERALLGLSGGIDSSVATALTVRAIGPENTLPILMPSKFSSKESVSDGEELVNNLQVESKTVGVQEVVDQYYEVLHPHFQDSSFGVTEENIQARSRAVLLMGFANKFGHLVLNTSNKSEIAVGYGTLYGDLIGSFSVLGDVYKTQVYKLGRYINQEKAVIPENVFIKPPSAELRPDQEDEDTLPPYNVLDPILYQYIEKQKSIQEIVEEGFKASTVKRAVTLVNQNEYKRWQTPPVLRVSEKAFGEGRRMPLVANYQF